MTDSIRSKNGIQGLSSIQSLKKNKRWTLLLVEEHGKIISVENFKALLIATALVLLISITAAFYFFITYSKALQEKKSLQNDLEAARKDIVSLHDDKELLMVRLVVAEKHVANKAASANRSSSQKKQPPEAIKDSKKQQGKKPAFSGVKKTLSVDIENFRIALEPDKKTVSARFKLKNTSDDSKPVAGYSFVVVKGDKTPEDKWLIMPPVKIIGGKPGPAEKGRFFSIKHFSSLHFKQKVHDNPGSFTVASIFVFSSKGGLLLKKSFPVDIKIQEDKAAAAKSKSDSAI